MLLPEVRKDVLQAKLLIERAREDLAVYTALVHKTEEGRPAIPPMHLYERVIPVLMDDTLGNTVIVAPPGSAKTMTLISACGWWLGRDPTQHIGFISNTGGQAGKRGLAIRDTITYSTEYRTIFPESRPNPSKGWGGGEWYLERPNFSDKDPTLVSAGVLGAILGARFDRIVFDDIADRENMSTAYQRSKIIDWLTRTALTRLTPRGRAVMICTRWAEEDPAQWAKDLGWNYVHIDAVNEDGPTKTSYWPDYWPIERLECVDGVHGKVNGVYCWEMMVQGVWKQGVCKQREHGTRAYVQQYRGRVVDDSSAMIKRDYWKFYGTPPEAMTNGGIFVDMAHTEKTHADNSVISVVQTDGVNFYVLDQLAIKVEFPELKRAIQLTRAKWDLPIWIEETPGSMPLIQSLRRELSRVMPWKHGGRSKMARVQVCLPYWEAGNVFVPESSHWARDLIDEAALFPLGLHDDRVDTMTMAIMTLAPGKLRFGAA